MVGILTEEGESVYLKKYIETREGRRQTAYRRREEVGGTGERIPKRISDMTKSLLGDRTKGSSSL